jgi:simple sugar transport system ATP-binding protein
MRNGMLCGDLKASETDKKELSRLMIGEDIIAAERQNDENRLEKEIKLELDHVTVKNKGNLPILKDISFQIHAGEILSIAGVSGNGQEELCEVICGVLKATEGHIYLNGDEITHASIRDRISKGIGYAPVDRHRDGMIMNMTLAENMMLRTSYDEKWKHKGLIDKKKLDAYTNEAIAAYNIKAPGPDAEARGLSGGNQQKVILAREVDNGSQLLILNQPTRGLDLGAINNIHTSILDERKKGKSVLLVSTELSEIFELSDWIAVIYKGSLMGIYRNGELTTEKIGLLMAGYTLESEVRK